MATRPLAAQEASDSSASDPFDVLRSRGGEPAAVPPRALAVIPERHTGRMIRVVDVLTRIEPQFDDLARGFGLTGRSSIQFRTREANVPIFVAKTPATIATLLQIEVGATITIDGILVERGGRYLLLASDVRLTPPDATRRPR